MKKISISAIFIAFFSITAFAESIVLKNNTDRATYNQGGPTDIKLQLITKGSNNDIKKGHLDEMILKPGQEIKVDVNELPALDTESRLLVKYLHNYENILMGFSHAGPEELLGIHKIDMAANGNPEFGPNYNVTYDSKFQIKEISFGYSNSFDVRYS